MRWEKHLSIIKIIFLYNLISVLCLLNFSIFPVKTMAQAFKRLKEGDTAKPISLKTTENIQISIEDYKNKNILGVIFWKSNNPKNISALKYMQKMEDTYGPLFGLKIISIYCPTEPKNVSTQEIEDIKDISSKNNISIPVLLDNDLKIFSSLGVISLPSIMILNKDGVAQYILAGFPEFGADKDISKNIGIPEEPIAAKKYEPNLNASRNYKLAVAVLAQGNMDKAIDYLNNAIQTDPKYPEPYALLGQIYAEKQNNDKALENYRKSLELDPDNNKLILRYGFLCLELGLTDDALLIFRNIAEQSNENAVYGHFGIGSIFMHNEIFDTARKESEKAFDLFEKLKKASITDKFYKAQTVSNLAYIHLNLNDKSNAIMNFKKALKLYNEILNEPEIKKELPLTE
ncbi:tetratricopeptide repeat protein [Candidatus Desantisbacteria bacterium]|nr:tetratricopeptide repeat protein [Candidatus Desantisbacteria bacterium]